MGIFISNGILKPPFPCMSIIYWKEDMRENIWCVSQIMWICGHIYIQSNIITSHFHLLCEWHKSLLSVIIIVITLLSFSLLVPREVLPDQFSLYVHKEYVKNIYIFVMVPTLSNMSFLLSCLISYVIHSSYVISGFGAGHIVICSDLFNAF